MNTLLPTLLNQRDWQDEIFHSNKVNIQPNEGGTTVELEIPGFKKSEIKIEFDQGYMTVSAKNDKRSYFQEFGLGEIDQEKTSAKLEDGILEIKLFKNVKVLRTITVT